MTSFWKKISIQYDGRVGIRINLEDTTTIGVKWRAINDAAITHGTFKPIAWKATNVRSDFSDGFVNGV